MKMPLSFLPLPNNHSSNSNSSTYVPKSQQIIISALSPTISISPTQATYCVPHNTSTSI